MTTATRSEQLRAAIIAFAQSLLPFLVLVGVITWTSDVIAACMLVVSNSLTMFFLFLPNRTPQPPPSTTQGP